MSTSLDQDEINKQLSKDVRKITEALIAVTDGMKAHDLMDHTGLDLKACEEIKKLVERVERITRGKRTFVVTVDRTAVRTKIFEIEATDEDQARDIALRLASNTDFGSGPEIGTPDYEICDVEERL